MEQTRYDMLGGDLLIIYPGEAHGAEDVIQNRSVLCYFLMTVPTAPGPFCMLDPSEREILWQRLRELPSRMLKVPASVQREMDRLYSSVGTGAPLGAARTRLRLMDFLFQVLDENVSASPLPEDISAVIRCIRENRGEMLDISRMAASVSLSESRFKQKFKQATGIPPVEFMIREKIEESKILLQDAGRTVTSVAMELGFTSSQHFSVLFKKYVGESPAQFRKRNGFV